MAFAHGSNERQRLSVREYEGYFYSINRQCDNTIYLECKEKLLKKCKATAVLAGSEFSLKRPHNHAIDKDIIDIHLFKDKLYTATISSLRRFRVIYDEISVLYPAAAARVTFKSIERSMLRWRRSHYPPVPQSLVHYAELANLEKWQYLTVYNGGTLTLHPIRDVYGFVSIVYADIRFIQSITSTYLHIDATFQVCPRNPKVLQFLTIMARIDDSVLPIAWALMTRKTKESYIAVLEYFANVLAPHIRPTAYMTDFELALVLALQTVYTEATSERCYFHFCQCLLKRAKKDKILQRIQNSQEKKSVFKQMMALALLPADDIPRAFDYILTTSTSDVAVDFSNLFQYFADYWLNKVTPQVFSVFGMQCKTNNYIESYHRVLKIRMGIHPSIWEFTEHVVRLQAVVHNSHASLDGAFTITRPSKERYVLNQAILQRVWQLYENNIFDIPRFLACTNRILKTFGNDNRFNSIQDLDNFINNIDLSVPERQDLQGLRLMFQVEIGGNQILYPII